jgi:hypothetical protein
MDSADKKVKGNRGTCAIRCALHITWAVDLRGVILINGSNGDVLHLGYPAAAIWDLMQRYHSFDEIVNLLSAITLKDAGTTECLLSKTLHEWIEQGILVMGATDG